MNAAKHFLILQITIAFFFFLLCQYSYDLTYIMYQILKPLSYFEIQYHTKKNCESDIMF